MSSLRTVTVIVTADQTGDTYLARPYPIADRDNNGLVEVYRVPVYNLKVKGTDPAGKAVTTIWPVLRFMPYFNSKKNGNPSYKTKGWVNSGLHQLSKRAVALYKADYTVHNRDSRWVGAIQMRGTFLIHAGPADISEWGWGSAGCVEVFGNFDTFKNHLRDLSGSTKPTSREALLEMVAATKLYVQVDHAKPPDIQASYDGERKPNW